jgi:hypothetical protein
MEYRKHGIPANSSQIIDNVNSETNFWSTRNRKNVKRGKIIRIMTDIRVNSVLLDYLILEFSGMSVSGKVQILVSLKNPENDPFSGENQKMDRFSVKCQKFSGLGFTDDITPILK